MGVWKTIRGAWEALKSKTRLKLDSVRAEEVLDRELVWGHTFKGIVYGSLFYSSLKRCLGGWHMR